jgi:hypothetical protein
MARKALQACSMTPPINWWVILDRNFLYKKNVIRSACTQIAPPYSSLVGKMKNCKELKYKQQRLTFCKIQVLEFLAKRNMEAY